MKVHILHCDKCGEKADELIEIGTWEDYKMYPIITPTPLPTLRCKDLSRKELCNTCFDKLKEWLGEAS